MSRLACARSNSNALSIGAKHIRPESLRGKNEDRSIFGGVDNASRRGAGTAPTTASVP